jgi:hypothetical protein
MKDILVIRFAKQLLNISLEEKEFIHESFYAKFNKDFYIICFWDENETNKTEFEIIKTK